VSEHERNHWAPLVVEVLLGAADGVPGVEVRTALAL
jgi:hypothetical protein